MQRLFGCTNAALLALTIAAIGCGGTTTKVIETNGDGGTITTPQVCTPKSVSCLNDQVSLTCTDSGNALIPIQCGVGQKCTAGVCTGSGGTTCTSDENTCTDATHASVCTTSGTSSVACPANTVCVGPGLCQGACVVGSSTCLDNGTLATCKDGNTYTASTCGTGMGCVTTGTDPVNTAACMPAACTPDPTGCSFVCGDKTNTAGSNAASTVSTCVSTPEGNKWVAIACPSPQTCNSTAATCSTGGLTAACASACNPGDTRCTGPNSYATCGMDGTWSTTVTACNADVTQSSTLCLATTNGQAVCGDPVCTTDGVNVGPAGSGACDSSGQFHACTNGKVSATGAACMPGQCIQTSNGYPGQLQPGYCQTDCQAGDQQCIGGSSYQTCNNGVWSTAQECAGGVSCQNTTSTNGRPNTACGVCVPGTHRCGPMGGLETCMGNGTSTPTTWSTEVACTLGVCTNVSMTEAACMEQCKPGSTVCLGMPTQVPGVGIFASSMQGTCSATGTLPTTGTACVNGTDGNPTYCRTSPSNSGTATSYGCVTCVGTQNELGLPDTRCDGNAVEVCSTGGTWDKTDEVTCTGNNATCVGPSTSPLPQQLGNYCHSDFFCGSITCDGGPITQSLLSSIDQGGTCQVYNVGTPGPCGSGPNTVTDCCSNYCYADQAPNPAYCN